MALVAGCASAQAGQIPVPNGSFESPKTEFADPRIDSWQKTPKPDWYDESGGYLWTQLTGAFLNTAPGTADHIDNCDGAQAVFLFAVPLVGFFQDYESTDWSTSTPSHAFDARFDVGKAYRLTVGLAGGGGGMKPGVSLMLALYYRDAAQSFVTVAATHVVYTPDVFPNLTHLVDVRVDLPPVKATDPWAGQHVGIQLLSTVDPALVGGYWDLDNIRLEAIVQPTIANPGFAQGRFGFTLQSEPGQRFEVLATANPGQPLASWTVLTTLTNATGSVEFRDEPGASAGRFYQVRQVE